MKLGTLLTIKCVSAVLGIMAAVILHSVGCQVFRDTYTRGWGAAIDELKYSGLDPKHSLIYSTEKGFEVVITPEGEREAESSFTVFLWILSALAVLAVGSFFSFRWSKAEIARNRGSPPTKD